MPDYTNPPTPDEYSPFYAGYVALVPEGGIIAHLERQATEFGRLLESIPEDRGDHAYAPGKWTIKEVVGHLADAERVFAYRALRFARGDATPLAPFDEDAYVPPAAFGARTLADLGAEFQAARLATIALLRGLPAEAWTRRGIASGHEISVRALAWITAGHELHHRKILNERYGVR